MPYHYVSFDAVTDTVRTIEANGETVNVVVGEPADDPTHFHIFTTSGPPRLSVRDTTAAGDYANGGRR